MSSGIFGCVLFCYVDKNNSITSIRYLVRQYSSQWIRIIVICLGCPQVFTSVVCPNSINLAYIEI